MYASEEPTRLSKILEISTWVLLFLALVPGTALAFFAENSLPTSPLYPVKRGIEKVVLTLVSVDNATKSSYQLTLANTRVKEVGALFASPKSTQIPEDVQQLGVVTEQIAATRQSIETVQNPVQKAQMKQQLTTTIIAYQQQLTTLTEQIQVSQATNTTSGSQQTTGSTPITTAPNTSNTSTQPTDIPPAPPPLAGASLTTQQAQDLQTQIQTQQQQLQQLQQSLVTPPTGTILSPTATPMPTFPPPSPTTTFQQRVKHGGDNGRND